MKKASHTARNDSNATTEPTLSHTSWSYTMTAMLQQYQPKSVFFCLLFTAATALEVRACCMFKISHNYYARVAALKTCCVPHVQQKLLLRSVRDIPTFTFLLFG